MWNRIIKVLLCFWFVFGTWFVAKPVTVNACSCAETPTIEEQLNQKTAIFSGKVLSLTKPDKEKMRSSADAVKVQFEVNTVWKGELSSQTTVYTAWSSESCGYEDFEVNEEYIVFAYGDLVRLETGLCSGNKILSAAQEELSALGAGSEPSKVTFPQTVQSEISTINNESDRSFVIAVIVLAISLISIVLLVIFLRRRHR